MTNECSVNVDVEPYFMCEGYTEACDYFVIEKRTVLVRPRQEYDLVRPGAIEQEYNDCKFRIKPYLCTNAKARQDAYSAFLEKLKKVNDAYLIEENDKE